jgi:hypothetical protein
MPSRVTTFGAATDTAVRLRPLLGAGWANQVLVAGEARAVDAEVEPGIGEAEVPVQAVGESVGVPAFLAVVSPVADRAGGTSSSIATACTSRRCLLNHAASLSRLRAGRQGRTEGITAATVPTAGNSVASGRWRRSHRPVVQLDGGRPAVGRCDDLVCCHGLVHGAEHPDPHPARCQRDGRPVHAAADPDCAVGGKCAESLGGAGVGGHHQPTHRGLVRAESGGHGGCRSAGDQHRHMDPARGQFCCEKPRSVRIDGSATFMTEESMMSVNWTAHNSSGVNTPRRVDRTERCALTAAMVGDLHPTLS